MTRSKAAQAPRREVAKITQMHLDNACVANDEKPFTEFKTYEPLPGVIPKDKEKATFAMDATPYEVINAVYAGTEYSGFRGYPALAETERSWLTRLRIISVSVTASPGVGLNSLPVIRLVRQPVHYLPRDNKQQGS